jgi:hypothetical protein
MKKLFFIGLLFTGLMYPVKLPFDKDKLATVLVGSDLKNFVKNTEIVNHLDEHYNPGDMAVIKKIVRTYAEAYYKEYYDTDDTIPTPQELTDQFMNCLYKAVSW